MVQADGSDLRQLTQFEGPDGHPRWAPDGKSFLFVSPRDEGAQIWRMPIDGGEPRQLTHISTGVAQATWSPDGKRIAFVSRVYPGYGADDSKNKAQKEAIKNNPIQAHIADHLLFRHWTSYRDGTRNHILMLDLETEVVTDMTPGDFESPSFQLFGHGFAFSPDGQEICFVSNREAPDARAWTTNKDLLIAPREGGWAVNLTEANKAFDGNPRYSPDGRMIAFARQEKPGFEADRFRLSIYDRDAGTTRVITDKFDAWVLAYQWSGDSRSIVFQSAVQGRFPLFRVDVASGAVERISGIPSVHEFDLSSEGKLAFVHSGVGEPFELYVGDLVGGEPMRVTKFNQELVTKHDFRPVEETWVPGVGGKPVHMFVVKPHGFTKGQKYPVIINVHGGPQYQWADTFRGDWQVYPGAGYVLVFPNPHGSIGYGQAYTDAISKDWGGKVYEDVMAVTEAVSRLDYVDADRMGAMGWSYGGYMMNWLMGHTDRFKAMASMMGIYDLESFWGSTEELWFAEWDLGGTPWDNPEGYRKFSPSTFVKNFKTPTLIISGEKDYRIPYVESVRLFTALRRRDIAARLILFPNDGHWPNYVKSMPLYYAAHLDWFHRYLGGKPSPYDPTDMVQGRAFLEEKAGERGGQIQPEL